VPTLPTTCDRAICLSSKRRVAPLVSTQRRRRCGCGRSQTRVNKLENDDPSIVEPIELFAGGFEAVRLPEYLQNQASKRASVVWRWPSTEVAPSHSITSSASASKFGGSSRPIDFEVFKLTANR
jgi:hypothetical protein